MTTRKSFANSHLSVKNMILKFEPNKGIPETIKQPNKNKNASEDVLDSSDNKSPLSSFKSSSESNGLNTNDLIPQEFIQDSNPVQSKEETSQNESVQCRINFNSNDSSSSKISNMDPNIIEIDNDALNSSNIEATTPALKVSTSNGNSPTTDSSSQNQEKSKRILSVNVEISRDDLGKMDNDEIKIEILTDALPISADEMKKLLAYLQALSDNEARLHYLTDFKNRYLFSSSNLLELLNSILSVKTRLAIVNIIGPRLTDPTLKNAEIIEMFRFADEKEKVEAILKKRAVVLGSSLFNKSRGQSSGSVLASSPGRGTGRGLGRGGGRGGLSKSLSSPVVSPSQSQGNEFKKSIESPSNITSRVTTVQTIPEATAGVEVSKPLFPDLSRDSANDVSQDAKKARVYSTDSVDSDISIRSSPSTVSPATSPVQSPKSNSPKSPNSNHEIRDNDETSNYQERKSISSNQSGNSSPQSNYNNFQFKRQQSMNKILSSVKELSQILRTRCQVNIDERYKVHILPDEFVVYCGEIVKRKGWSYRRRMLILTSKPRLFYVTPHNPSIYRGHVSWTQTTPIEIVKIDSNHFDIHLFDKSRVYHMNDKIDSSVWVEVLSQMSAAWR